MKINETIKGRRKELGLTQEQVAERLGVTASAVYKWEKGTAYPDVTLLPPLARLLRTDLNTLLSFREDLTPQEVQAIVGEIVRRVEENGYEAAFCLARERLQEFPACEELLLNLALTLEGVQMFYPEKAVTRHDEEIMKWYDRLSASENRRLREQAVERLFYTRLNQGRYQEAEEMLERLEQSYPRYAGMKAGLYERQGRLKEARAVMENKLLASAGEVQSALTWLHSCALKEQDLDRAQMLAGRLEKLPAILDLWEYGAYVPYLELYAAKKDVENSIRTLRKLFQTGGEPWIAGECGLYPDLSANTEESILQKRTGPMLLELIKKDASMEFLRNSREGQAFIQEMEKAYSSD